LQFLIGFIFLLSDELGLCFTVRSNNGNFISFFLGLFVLNFKFFQEFIGGFGCFFKLDLFLFQDNFHVLDTLGGFCKLFKAFNNLDFFNINLIVFITIHTLV